MEPVNVLIVDDSQIFREGLKHIFKKEEYIRVIGEACNLGEVEFHLEKKKTDIVLTDIKLKGKEKEINTVEYLHHHHPELGIIVLFHQKDVGHVIKTLKFNTKAYLVKENTSPEELLHIIRSSVKSKCVSWGTNVLRVLEPYYGKEEHITQKKQFGLTEREIEIIRQMALGLSSKEIGKELNINSTTVETHKENIKNKLKVNTGIQIIAFALRNKIIQ